MSVHLGLCSCECVALCIYTSKFLEEIERDSHRREEGVTNMRSRATVKGPFRLTLQTISAQGSLHICSPGGFLHIFSNAEAARTLVQKADAVNANLFCSSKK